MPQTRPAVRRVALGLLMALGLLATSGLAQTLPPVTDAPPGPLAPAPPPVSDPDVDDLLSRPLPEPDEVFGYVSVDVAATPFDEQWRRASTSPWPAGNAELDAFVGRIRALSVPLRVDAANRWVNAHVAYASDMEVYGVADYWAGLAEALAHGRGDCEDFAIAKMQLLAAAGVPARDMYLTLVRDLRRQEDHAVLVVRVGDGAYVLDSNENTLMRSDELHRFRPVAAFSEDGRWIFGRRTPEAEAEMAREVPDLPPETPAPSVAAFMPGGR
jgi:transglutaminase-like putative cysteine protease